MMGRNLDGKIKATPAFGGFALVGQWVTALSRKRNGVVYSASPMKLMRMVPPFAGFAVSGGVNVGRQGKSLAVPAAYVVGIIEFSGRPPERACQRFPLQSQ
jgi:hypothetical protein